MAQIIPIKNVDTRLTELNAALEKLHAIFEQHFQGLIRIPPTVEHERFKTELHSFGPAELKSTAYKFRFEGIRNRYYQFNNLWTKTLKEIEEGTYRRDLFLLKAKDRAGEKIKSSLSKKSAAPAKETKLLEKLYDKVVKATNPNHKVPERTSFVNSLQKKLDQQKKKHPGRALEIKLQRNAKGGLEVKISAKGKKKK